MYIIYIYTYIIYIYAFYYCLSNSFSFSFFPLKAYFLLSGRLSNEVLIGNKVTELLVETSAPTSMFKSHSKRQEEEDRKKQNNQESNQYITMPTLYPGSEIHVDCLRPSHVGKKTRTKRDRTVKALDNVFLFRLTKEGFDEGSAEQDFNEDFHIWKFFQDKSAGGLGQKVFSKFTQQMENEWKSLWHLETFESGSLLTKQGERALKVFVCSHGTLEVIRRTENNQLLVIDRPRIGEFVCSGASALIKSVQKTIPVYKTLAQTSLIAKTATDCFVASADAFYNFCYQYKWVGNFLHDYFSVLGLNDIQAKTSMFNQSEWNLQKKKIVNSNIDKTLFRLNAKGMQTGTFAKDPVLLRKQQTGPKIFRKKKVHRIKPIAVAVLNQIVDDIPKKKNKKKKKKKKENKLTPCFQTSKKILETSHSIYALLEKNRKSTKKSSKNTSKSKSKSLPMLPKVKERLKQRYEASMQLHKKRYGSHRLIRGSDLRWYVKGT